MLDSEWHSRFSAALAKVFPFHVPFVPPEVAGLGSPMADLSQRFAKVVRNLRWRRTRGDRTVTVDFQLARQPSIGAFVFADGDEHFVVFHHLMFSGLLDTFARLVDHLPLEAAHDSEPIQGPQLPLLDLISATEAVPRHDISAAELGLASYYPRSAGRLALAVKLQVLALEFLFWHEVHHLICGHVGATENSGIQRGIEEGGRPPGRDMGEARAMEFTADLFATENLVDSMLGGRLILIPPAAIRPGAESTETLLYMATFAVTTLFALFRSYERIHVPEGDRNYPSVLARYATFVDRITKRLDRSERRVSARSGDIATHALSDLRIAMQKAGYAEEFLAEIESDTQLDRAFHDLTPLAERALELQPTWSQFSVICS